MELVLLVAVGLMAGTLGSLLGLGGGFLIVPFLILARGLDARMATGTAIAVIVPTMLMALWRRGIAQSHVEWKTAAILAVGALGGAVLGSWLAGRMDPIWIRRGFAAVLLVLAVVLLLGEPGRPLPAPPLPEEPAAR